MEVCALGEGIGNLESGIGKREVLNVVGSAYLRPAWGSGMLLGCLETPPAFLEAVPSAWTVTRGVVDALRASTK